MTRNLFRYCFMFDIFLVNEILGEVPKKQHNTLTSFLEIAADKNGIEFKELGIKSVQVWLT